MTMRAPAFWQHDGLWAHLLAPAGWALAEAGRLRRRVVHPAKLPIPVLCVGNLTVGGTGKTPVVLALAAALDARGRVHCLTRGYGGSVAGPVVVDPASHDARAV